MTIFFAAIAMYVFAYVRLVIHEYAHFIVAKYFGASPYRLCLGGYNVRVEVQKLSVYLGWLPLIGACWYQTDNLTPKKWGLVHLAGPVADLIFLPVATFAAYAFLPFWVFFGVGAVSLALFCSMVESSFHRGQDLNEFFRLTFSKSSA